MNHFEFKGFSIMSISIFTLIYLFCRHFGKIVTSANESYPIPKNQRLKIRWHLSLHSSSVSSFTLMISKKNSFGP